jgi:hypothetical protein
MLEHYSLMDAIILKLRHYLLSLCCIESIHEVSAIGIYIYFGHINRGDCL